MWALFEYIHNTIDGIPRANFIGIFDTYSSADRARGFLIVKYNVSPNTYFIKEILVNKIYTHDWV